MSGWEQLEPAREDTNQVITALRLPSTGSRISFVAILGTLKNHFFTQSVSQRPWCLAYACAVGDVVSFVGFSYLVVGIDGNSKLTIWVKTAKRYRDEEIH